MSNVKIFANPEQLTQTAADLFIDKAKRSIQEHGAFRVVLSGGTTPQNLYQMLASEPYRDQIPWDKVHIFWGDERCVPPDQPESNYYRAKDYLLSKVPVREENIYRVPSELRPEQAAEAYEETLLQYFSGLPDGECAAACFDLILLGMGDDGHTASLFPGTAAVNENARWVAAVYVDRLAAWRVTLTPALINRAAYIAFLVSGAGKSYTLQRVLYGAYQPDRYPAQVIKPENGELTWLVDEAAASLF